MSSDDFGECMAEGAFRRGWSLGVGFRDEDGGRPTARRQGQREAARGREGEATYVGNSRSLTNLYMLLEETNHEHNS